MSDTKKMFFIRGLKIFHFFISLFLFAFVWRTYTTHYGIGIAYRYSVFVYALYALLLFFFFRTYNAYLIEYSQVADVAFSLCLSTSISIAAVYVIVLVAWSRMYSPVSFLILMGVQILVNIGWSLLASKIYYAIHKPVRAIVVYRNQKDLHRLDDIKRFDKKYNIVKYLESPKTYEEIADAMEGCETIFLAGVDANIRNGVAKYCVEHGIPGYFLPHVGDIILMGGYHVQAFSTPFLCIQRTSSRPEYIVIKRLFDIVLSLLAIIISSPVMLVTALAIKLYDGGPVLYKQVRLTKNRKEFSILKFRSMRTDAEKDGVARLSTGDADDRITAVGRFIRACRLDELPQLFNILKGDMSIVGPRPERPEIAEQYEKKMPTFKLRLQVKAGLTGYAQVYGKYNTDPYDKVEMDLIYINKMNFLFDIQLMFATIRVLFLKESSSGIASGEVTAMKQEEES